MPLQVSEHDDFPLPMGLCPLLRGQEYHASNWSVTEFMVVRQRKGTPFFWGANGRKWPETEVPRSPRFGRDRVESRQNSDIAEVKRLTHTGASPPSIDALRKRSTELSLARQEHGRTIPLADISRVRLGDFRCVVEGDFGNCAEIPESAIFPNNLGYLDTPLGRRFERL
jgi:hypothetical protein